MKYLVLTDKDSWFVEYLNALSGAICRADPLALVDVIHDHHSVKSSYDICLLLSYSTIVNREFLALNDHNLVVHESDLPQGRGMSPLSWQVLAGRSSIPIVLIEAVEALDAGNIYYRDTIELNGDELVDELRELQADKTMHLIERFIRNYPNNTGTPQVGVGSVYKRRMPEDSQLSINESILSQINLLRICDNERYPAFFEYQGQRYELRIKKAK